MYSTVQCIRNVAAAVSRLIFVFLIFKANITATFCIERVLLSGSSSNVVEDAVADHTPAPAGGGGRAADRWPAGGGGGRDGQTARGRRPNRGRCGRLLV